MRILQISDTHISAEHADFAANVDAIAEAVARLRPDLVINTGDLSMNGCVTSDDLELARDWQRRIDVPVLSVPGNHDVGDRHEIRADQALNDVRVARFRGFVGPDRWTFDLSGWRLIGLNAMLFGTGHAEEQAQSDWLEEAISTTAKVAVFMHKPLFIDHPDEGPRGYWTVAPEPRQHLLRQLDRCDLKLIASGHLHIARTLKHDGVTHVWCPASSFVCGDIQEDLGGERRIGLVDYTFEATGFSHNVIFPETTRDIQLDPVQDRIYPAPRNDTVQAELT